jgi:hypothetical protein
LRLGFWSFAQSANSISGSIADELWSFAALRFLGPGKSSFRRGAADMRPNFYKLSLY